MSMCVRFRNAVKMYIMMNYSSERLATKLPIVVSFFFYRSLVLRCSHYSDTHLSYVGMTIVCSVLCLPAALPEYFHRKSNLFFAFATCVIFERIMFRVREVTRIYCGFHSKSLIVFIRVFMYIYEILYLFYK